MFDLTLQVSAEYEILVEFGITFDVKSCVSYNGYNILDQTGASGVGVWGNVLKGQSILVLGHWLG